MPPPFPYTFYACPCTETQAIAATNDENNELDQERTFNPHDPLSAYSLYTLDHLLFCDECNQIKCAKCVGDEIVNWYCPNCLFEVPSGSVKSEGNRCSRNCYSCPSCTAPLAVTLLESNEDPSLKDADEGTYILACQYCAWTSLDIDVRFNRPTKITDQLNKAYRGRLASKEQESSNKEGEKLSPEDRFEKLTAFYKEQLLEAGETSTSSGYGSYSSPANLARIINLYGGLSHTALKKSQEKQQSMREAKPEEGLSTYDAADAADTARELIDNMHRLGWSSIASETQRVSAPVNYDAHLASDLWPMAMRLRTRRGKRCRQCRQFVIRPDVKITSTKYRLRIIAINHIPRLTIRALENSRPVQNPSFILRNDQLAEDVHLQSHTPQSYVLTLRNPIFETVKVTLATSAVTPGQVPSRVTILCPTFTIGPAGDVWEDALSTTTNSASGDGSRKAAMASLTGINEADRQPEAGKVWEQTRNSTSVVLEIVPGALEPGTDIEDGDDILEVPIYVRVEWTAEVDAEGEQKGATERVAKELAYWSVLGIGRISS